MRYYLEYVLGMPSPAGKPAALGTIFHKVFEIRALAKKNQQSKRTSFVDDNLGKLTVKESKDYKNILDKSWDYYKKIETHVDLLKSDKTKILGWIEKTLNDYPNYDPFNMNIVEAEMFFDFEIKKPWAEQEITIAGETVKNNLRIKGTMDTVVKLSDGVYELVDYKTGAKRNDFATGVEKTLEYHMTQDKQLMLYAIALKEAFPEVELIVSLFWVNTGGIFSVPCDEEYLSNAWRMLEKDYKKIVKTYTPTQLDPKHKDWRCKYVCAFSKKQSPNDKKSICQTFRERIRKDGLVKVTNEYGSISKATSYGDGGGRKNTGK